MPTYLSISDTNDVQNAPLVFICSDSFPSKSLFWLAKSTMANLTISPIYMPLIIFSNLKHRSRKHIFQTSRTVTRKLVKKYYCLVVSSEQHAYLCCPGFNESSSISRSYFVRTASNFPSSPNAPHSVFTITCGFILSPSKSSTFSTFST